MNFIHSSSVWYERLQNISFIPRLNSLFSKRQIYNLLIPFLLLLCLAAKLNATTTNKKPHLNNSTTIGYKVHFQTDLDYQRSSFTFDKFDKSFEIESINSLVIEQSDVYNISGKFLDENGRGINQVKVVLTNVKGGVYSGVSNQFGYFLLKNIKSGQFVIAPKHQSFEFKPKGFSLNGDLSLPTFFSQSSIQRNNQNLTKFRSMNDFFF